MNPIGNVFVSKSRGSALGTGSIDDPLDTIMGGVSLAESHATTDGHPWGVTVLASSYDEQIEPLGPDVTHITFMGGARLDYTGVGAAILDTNCKLSLHLMAGSSLQNSGGGDLFSLAAGNETEIIGDGELRTQGSGRLFEISNGSYLYCERVNLFSDGNSSSLAEISSGTARFVDCFVYQSNSASAFVKSGGDLKLYRCDLQTVHTDYISAPSAQDVQVVNCVCNVAAGANITETVQPMYVSSAFSI